MKLSEVSGELVEALRKLGGEYGPRGVHETVDLMWPRPPAERDGSGTLTLHGHAIVLAHVASYGRWEHNPRYTEVVFTAGGTHTYVDDDGALLVALAEMFNPPPVSP